MKFTDELTLLLKARYPIVYINTIEEDRVEYIIRKYIKTSLSSCNLRTDINNPNHLYDHALLFLTIISFQLARQICQEALFILHNNW